MSNAAAAGLYFPPVTAFPTPRDDEDESRPAKRPARRRPPTEAGKPKKSEAAEPGDEGHEVSWMAGLSNRLSAYSLNEDEPATPAEQDDGPDEPEDTGAETEDA
jgi:hypothetical protein